MKKGIDFIYPLLYYIIVKYLKDTLQKGTLKIK